MKIFCLPFFFLFTSIYYGQGFYEQDVLRADSTLNRCIKDHNVAQPTGYYLEQFMLTTSSGQQKTKADLLRETGNTALQLEINETLDAKVMFEGNTAIVTGRLHQKGIYNEKAFDYFVRVTDTWIYHQGTWKLLAGHASLISKP
jgi:hypothetical protein